MSAVCEVYTIVFNLNDSQIGRLEAEHQKGRLKSILKVTRHSHWIRLQFVPICFQNSVDSHIAG